MPDACPAGRDCTLLTFDEVLVRWSVAPDEQVHVSAWIHFPSVVNLWGDDDVVPVLKGGPLRPKNVGDPPAEDYGIFRICVPVQLKA